MSIKPIFLNLKNSNSKNSRILKPENLKPESRAATYFWQNCPKSAKISTFVRGRCSVEYKIPKDYYIFYINFEKTITLSSIHFCKAKYSTYFCVKTWWKMWLIQK